MSPRTGRPKADNPLSVDIKVRLDNDTNEKLLGYCENHNITRAEAIRKGIHLLLLGGRTAQRFSSHQRSPFDKSIISNWVASYKRIRGQNYERNSLHPG